MCEGKRFVWCVAEEVLCVCVRGRGLNVCVFMCVRGGGRAECVCWGWGVVGEGGEG
jgi:hypothetical protein